MYGLVHKAIAGLFTERKGPTAWAELTRSANVPSTYLSMETYPDEVTSALVGAASEALDMTVPSFLHDLGVYWVTYTGSEGYSDLFDMWGSDLRGFLSNLNQMHERVQTTMPHLLPPSFATEELADGRICLRYESVREGMAPMVLGLLDGLAAKFQTSVEIVHSVHRADAGHDEFLLTIGNE